MRDAAGEIDHFDAAANLAERIIVSLAVFGANAAGDLVGVLVEQLFKLEHVPAAL